MGVVPGTATTMIKALADSGLVAYEPRGGVRLTRGGEQLALHVLRRHRLVELFLGQGAGLDWSEVHAEAEELEHAISDKVLERIDAPARSPQRRPARRPDPLGPGQGRRGRHTQPGRLPIGPPAPGRARDRPGPRLPPVRRRCGLMPGTPSPSRRRDAQADAVCGPPPRPPARHARHGGGGEDPGGGSVNGRGGRRPTKAPALPCRLLAALPSRHVALSLPLPSQFIAGSNSVAATVRRHH